MFKSYKINTTFDPPVIFSHIIGLWEERARQRFKSKDQTNCSMQTWFNPDLFFGSLAVCFYYSS